MYIALYKITKYKLGVFANYFNVTDDKLIYFRHMCKLNSCNQIIKIVRVRNICAKIADLK